MDSTIEFCLVELTCIRYTNQVASIPKAHCFTSKTSSLHTNPSLYTKFTTTTSYASSSRSIIESITHVIPLLRLTIHLAHELSLGSQSPWSPYLNLISHPDHRTPALIQLFVDRVPELEDWFSGTHIARLMSGEDTCTLSFLKRHFAEGYPHDQIAWECFLRAFTICSSRAFEIDRYHQLGLVPFADLFDHSDEPDVQLQSQVYVCQQCGAQKACIHCYNQDDPNYHHFLEQQLQSKMNSPDSDHAVELTSLRALMPPAKCQRPSLSTSTATPEEALGDSSTVYNSYGELSNATLLTSYGFMIAANPHDKIYFDLSQVLEACGRGDVENTQQASSPHPSQCHEHPPDEACDSCKYKSANWQAFPEFCQPHDNNGLIGPLEPGGLWIDSSSKLSPALWWRIVHERLGQEVDSTGPPSVVDFQDIYRIQQIFDSLPEADLLALPTTRTPIDVVVERLHGVAAAVCDLVVQRQTLYHKPDLTIEQLLNLKEELLAKEKEDRPPESRIQIPIHQNNGGESEWMGVLPVAIEYSISERLLLKKTLEIWSHIMVSAGRYNLSRSL